MGWLISTRFNEWRKASSCDHRGSEWGGKSTLAPVLLRDTFGLLEFVNADTISAGLSAFNAEAVALAAGRVARASRQQAKLRV